jgi:hypothetical protein
MYHPVCSEENFVGIPLKKDMGRLIILRMLVDFLGKD